MSELVTNFKQWCFSFKSECECYCTSPLDGTEGWWIVFFDPVDLHKAA